ncbi:related to fatty-acid amide hydrolase 1 [Phialocephala subalpina]|uniref:amidase n=1 Tax=Phialocephala subalpina TaxID=576137 RepID=A0A1L7XW82_9HELO|nr:related to fatty-acid amide hydrolase 1 [Phialocephala subalpina]
MAAIPTPITPGKSWQDIRDLKKAEQAARIPAEWKLKGSAYPPVETVDVRPVVSTSRILSERELKITGDSYDATTLAAAIANGTYSAEEVAIAFCKRAAIGQQLCNNLTEIMFLDAIEDAKKLDAYFEETGKTVGPLHGLPMTFKECFHVKGYDYSNGYISRTFNPSTTTTYAIELVKAAGAVIIAKTNVPQTMLVAEADNNVFGQTKNPVVHHLTCGGSSGGEGSNMAFRGSAIGIGTDVGGSIRVPAAANGVYGFKPTCGVLPFYGYAASGYTGVNTGIPATLGPLANSARDLALLTKVVRDAKPWLVDPAVVPGVYEQATISRKPVVGVIHKSGLTPHPPIQRAVREAVAKLQDAGFEVKDFTPPDFGEIRKVTKQLFTLDALSYQKRELEKAGEPVVKSVVDIGFWQLSAKTQEEAWEWNTKRLGICKQMLDEWQRTKVDVVLCPTGPHTAVLPGEWSNDMYTVAWNAVDYPAVIIPFTNANPALDPKDTNFVPMNDLDVLNEAKYDPQLMAGAPAALQIVGPKWGDAQLLKDVEVIDAVLNPNTGADSVLKTQSKL